jgi:peptidyl-prolyl cis-trans isomerase C
MIPAGNAREERPEFNYHLLRNALQDFNRNPAQLDADEYHRVYAKALKSFELESLVIASDEAGGVVIPGQLLEASVERVVSRYANIGEYLDDLENNGLNEIGLRCALHRELLFDAVMQRITFGIPDVSDIDVKLFYEMHRARFEAPEQRIARHILITVNPDFPENIRTESLLRIQRIRTELKGRVNRFHDFAVRYSECPSAMDGGRLGEVRCGQLYAELDALLFSMQAGEISQIVESELGFHILLCEQIKPGKRLSPSKAAPGIRRLLEGRRRRNCQRRWLASLRRNSPA